jgi:hypothetical protein
MTPKIERGQFNIANASLKNTLVAEVALPTSDVQSVENQIQSAGSLLL